MASRKGIFSYNHRVSQHTIYLVEDQLATREYLQESIDVLDEFDVCGESGTIAEADRQIRETRPDILLVDIGLPDGSGITLIETFGEERPEMPILVISVFGDEHTVISAIEAGAQGYLLKTDSAESIDRALRQILSGGSPISPQIARHLIARFRPAREISKDTGNDLLSVRELEVLQYAAKGYSFSEIAKLMAVSPNTIGSYTKRIYTKLAVSSKSQAVFEAMRIGIVQPPRD